MRWSYTCPFCREVLNRNDTIMLTAICGDDEIMIGLHPRPGNYEVATPPGFELEPGSRWDFICPSCRESLVSDLSPDLSCLDMVTKSARHRVHFSRVAGEHATFVISSAGVERHGEHAERHSLEILELI